MVALGEHKVQFTSPSILVHPTYNNADPVMAVRPGDDLIRGCLSDPTQCTRAAFKAAASLPSMKHVGKIPKVCALVSWFRLERPNTHTLTGA